jgi:hypothetical protein
MTQVMAIRHQQTLDLSDTGQLREGRDVEVTLRYAALSGGWLARFSGSREGRSALPVLLALALHARPLAGEDFEKLKRLGLATDKDAGRLYCRITDVGLADELDLHRTTIPKVMDWLVAQRLVRIVSLPPEFSDSRGQFNGVRAYLLVADGMMTSTRVAEAGSAPVSPEPSRSLEAVLLQPTLLSVEVTPDDSPVGSTVSAQPTGGVSSTDTKKTTYQEREKERRSVRGDLDTRSSDSGRRLAKAWHTISGRHPDPAELARLDTLIGVPETGKLQVETLCALLPVWQSSGDATVSGVIASATQPVFTQALRLYAQEIGPVTSLTATELWALTQRHPDPARWERAFRKAVGIPESFRRWRYAQAILENRNGNNHKTGQVSQTDRSRTQSSAAGTTSRSRGSGRHTQGVWTPEEIERINAEAAARLAAQGITPGD